MVAPVRPARLPLALSTAALAIAIAAPLKAEEGDYSFWQTLVNLVSPPKADNKVTAEQSVGPYPLLNNPGGQNYREEWAHGLTLDYRSGYTEGTVGFGLDAYARLGLKLDSSRARTGTDLLPIDSRGRPEDHYAKAGGAVRMRVGLTELKYGDQLLTINISDVGQQGMLG